MNQLYSEMLEKVELEIAQLSLPKNPSNLYDPITYIMSLGGKRVRPILTLLGCELFGTHYSKAMNQAMAVEMFHNFTLVHDDVMDSAEVRRKLPTVHKKWNDNIALLSGDGMLVLAYQQLFKAPEDRLKRLADAFSKSAIEVCEGQQLDMDYANLSDVGLREYLEMIRLKTAVLLASSLQIGAIMGGASDERLIPLRQFAESLGLAFQVKDDYLDAFGNDDFGKAIGGDIAEGKRTWLTVKSFELADDHTKQRLSKAFSNSNTDQRIESVLEIYKELGVEKLAEAEVQNYSQSAIDALNSIEGDPKAKECLEWLVSQLIGRTT